MDWTSKSLTPSRRTVLKTCGAVAMTSAAATIAKAQAEPSRDPGVAEIVANTISVDMHNHMDQLPFTRLGANLPQAWNGGDGGLRRELKASGLSALCFTYAVDNFQAPDPGDWYQYHRQKMAAMDRVLAENGLRRALTAADLKTAHLRKQPIVIQDCEGAQWIEGRLERIEEAYRRGLRHMQLLHQMHDLAQPLGGVQQLMTPTGGAMAGKAVEVAGLTPFGADVIQECNRLGVVVDMAHATEQTGLDALKVSNRPLVVSHTALNEGVGRSHPLFATHPAVVARLVSKAYVKAVADAGGVIGLWHVFPTLKTFVTAIKEMADVAGVDHVGIGTDTHMHSANGASLRDTINGDTNTVWPDESGGFLYAVVAEMLAQGFAPAEISKIVGGNYVRVFEAVTGKQI